MKNRAVPNADLPDFFFLQMLGGAEVYSYLCRGEGRRTRCTAFAPCLSRRVGCNLQGRALFERKGCLLKLSSICEFSQNSYGTKMMAMAPHLFLIYHSVNILVRGECDISIRCGLLSYPYQGNARSLQIG